MKSFTFIALAAGVSATGFRNFPPFTCPDNTDNKCTEKQNKGFDFSDLDFGSFKQYNDFEWSGFTCETDDNDKRDRLGRRTGQKHIGGTCGPQKSGSPSFGVGKNIDQFSLHEIHVKPEFDCDLEFHYDMPDGKLCKHRSPCSKKGTKVPNTQCGGAKNVTIVYPPQPNKPKPKCSIKVPSISFGCNPPKSTKPPVNPPTSKPATTTARSTTTSKAVSSSTTSTTKSVQTTPPTPPTSQSTTTGVVSSSSTTGSVTTSTTTTKGVETTPPPSSTVVTTSFFSTSTILTTIVSTIISCPPGKPSCPNDGVTTTTNVVIVSTTICPVTQTTTISKPPTDTKPPTEKPTTNTPTTDKPQQSTSTSILTGTTTTKSSPPEPTLPCPDVVPKCLNTFMFSLGCKDNTDHACYCPDELFVKNIFTCLYAHGETDTIISEAVVFFQGICAPYVPQNPCIATGATITSYVTPTQTVTVPAIYTTITVVATTVVPCTSDGVEVTGSSTTTVINTTLTVPQVGFQTDNNDVVGVIPVTTPPVVQQPPRTTASPPTGTGSIGRPTPPIVTVNAGGRVGASFGLAAFVAVAVAAAL